MMMRDKFISHRSSGGMPKMRRSGDMEYQHHQRDQHHPHMHSHPSSSDRRQGQGYRSRSRSPFRRPGPDRADRERGHGHGHMENMGSGRGRDRNDMDRGGGGGSGGGGGERRDERRLRMDRMPQSSSSASASGEKRKVKESKSKSSDKKYEKGGTKRKPAVELDNIMKRAREERNNYWNKKVIEAEERDPNKWGHSGFKELYKGNSALASKRDKDEKEETRSRSPFRRGPFDSHSHLKSSRRSHSKSPSATPPHIREMSRKLREERKHSLIESFKKISPNSLGGAGKRKSSPRSPIKGGHGHGGGGGKDEKSQKDSDLGKRAAAAALALALTKRNRSIIDKLKKQPGLIKNKNDDHSSKSPSGRPSGKNARISGRRSSSRSSSSSDDDVLRLHPKRRDRASSMSSRSSSSSSSSGGETSSNSKRRKRNQRNVSTSSRSRSRSRSSSSESESDDSAKKKPIKPPPPPQRPPPQQKKTANTNPNLSKKNDTSSAASNNKKIEETPRKSEEKSQNGNNKQSGNQGSNNSSSNKPVEKPPPREKSDSGETDSSSSDSESERKMTLTERFARLSQINTDKREFAKPVLAANQIDKKLKVIKDLRSSNMKVFLDSPGKPSGGGGGGGQSSSTTGGPGGGVGRKVRPQSPEYGEGDKHYSYDERRRHFERMAKDLPDDRPEWSDARVRYLYYKDRGYFDERPLSLEEYVKWEDWWYKYRDWLENEGYYDRAPAPQPLQYSPMPMHNRMQGRDPRDPRGGGGGMRRGSYPPPTGPPQHHQHQHQQPLLPTPTMRGRIGGGGPPPSRGNARYVERIGMPPQHGPHGPHPHNRHLAFGRPPSDFGRRIGQTSSGSLVVNLVQYGGQNSRGGRRVGLVRNP